MNPPKYTATEYINFLIATQKAYSCSEAGRVQPEQPEPPAHDAITRLLHRLEPRPEELWEEAKESLELKRGILVNVTTLVWQSVPFYV